MGKSILKRLARLGALDADVAEKLIREQDGGPGSGNFGHAGRPGKKGGSAPGNGGGGGSAGPASSGGSTPQASASFGHAGRPGAKGGFTIHKPDNPKVNFAERTPFKEYNGPSGGAAWKPPRTTSPQHEKVSLATKDVRTLTKLQSSLRDSAAMKKTLDSMKPGAMIRLSERGYSVFTKKEDGSWVYQKSHGHEQPVQVDDVIKSAQNTGLEAVSAPKPGAAGRSQYWDNIRAVANLKPNAGDTYTGRKTSVGESIDHGLVRSGLESFPPEIGNESSRYTQTDIDENGVIHKAGEAVGKLKNGSGVTVIGSEDILKPNPNDRVFNTLSEFAVRDKNGNLVLTPEREKLHQDAIQEVFKDAEPVPEGQQKVFTMLGGGSAAGKGTIQSMMPELFNKESPVLDADEFKKRIPEYVDASFSDDHELAAMLAHEESSALVKRGMQAAFANGYNCTLDGTGDGRLDGPGGLKDKIETARKNGYKVEGVYVTCPTELAVKRNEARSKTDPYNRLVNENEVRKIHGKVSSLFETVAPMFDHVVLYDTNQPKGQPPKMIAECFYGQKVRVVPGCEKLYREFLDKAPKEPENKKKS